jgi:uncharacterized protein YeaO (DUF488 family)
MTAPTEHDPATARRGPGVTNSREPATPDLTDPEPALARWENEGGQPASFAAARTRRASTMTRAAEGMPHRRRVRVGRVYDERGPGEDIRVLVDRLWPRGLSRTRADLDDWCQRIAPSAALRTWYGHDPDRFAEFERRYRQELDEPERADAFRHLRGLAQGRTLILLTATRRPEISQAAVLADTLDGALANDP